MPSSWVAEGTGPRHLAQGPGQPPRVGLRGGRRKLPTVALRHQRACHYLRPPADRSSLAPAARLLLPLPPCSTRMTRLRCGGRRLMPASAASERHGGQRRAPQRRGSRAHSLPCAPTGLARSSPTRRGTGSADSPAGRATRHATVGARHLHNASGGLRSEDRSTGLRTTSPPSPMSTSLRPVRQEAVRLSRLRRLHCRRCVPTSLRLTAASRTWDCSTSPSATVAVHPDDCRHHRLPCAWRLHESIFRVRRTQRRSNVPPPVPSCREPSQAGRSGRPSVAPSSSAEIASMRSSNPPAS